MNLLSKYIEHNDRKTSQYNIRRISKISNNFSYYYKVFDPIDIWFKLLKIGTKIYVKSVSHSTGPIVIIVLKLDSLEIKNKVILIKKIDPC